MDFRKLLDQLNSISEDGDTSDAYKELTKNVPKSPIGKPDLNTAPNIDNTSASTIGQASDPNTGASQLVPAPTHAGESSAPLPVEVSNLRKQLNDLSTKLWQMNQQSIESGKYEGYSNIAKSLLESFDIFEADGGEMSNQRGQLVSQINTIIKQLEPYKNNPDVAQDIARAQRGIQAPVKPADLKITPEPEVTKNATPTSATTAGAQQHKIPTSNKDVISLQTALKAKGYDLGNFGPKQDGIDGRKGSKGSKTIGAIELAKKNGWDGKDINNIPKNTTTAQPTPGSSAESTPTPPNGKYDWTKYKIIRKDNGKDAFVGHPPNQLDRVTTQPGFSEKYQIVASNQPTAPAPNAPAPNAPAPNAPAPNAPAPNAPVSYDWSKNKIVSINNGTEMFADLSPELKNRYVSRPGFVKLYKVVPK